MTADPEAAALVPVPCAHGLPRSLVRIERRSCSRTTSSRGGESRVRFRSGDPARRQRQFVAERVLLVAALFVGRNARQAVLGIEQRLAVSVGGLERVPVLLHELQIAGDRIVVGDDVEKVVAQLDVHEHVRILAPLDHARALRQLVPDHAGLAILKLENELELLACTLIAPRREQGARGDHSIAREEPVVLRTARFARRPVSRDLPAAEIGIADPGLLQCDLRPRERAIRPRDPAFRSAIPELSTSS